MERKRFAVYLSSTHTWYTVQGHPRTVHIVTRDGRFFCYASNSKAARLTAKRMRFNTPLVPSDAHTATQEEIDVLFGVTLGRVD